MKFLLVISAALFFSVSLMAQADTPSVIVHKDARVDLLVKKQAQINEETTRDARRSAAGYRLQVINTNDRNAAINAKTKVYQLYPELKAYLIYQSPYFRLRVGNFKERSEAEEYRRLLAKEFPTGVNIVRDTIEVKPEKAESENR